MALEAEEISAKADVINFAMTRGIRAQHAAAQGNADEAERLAREGVDFAMQTDFPLAHGVAYEALARVTGDAADRERATACYVAKGYHPGFYVYS